jgi:hypothetical protein
VSSGDLQLLVHKKSVELPSHNKPELGLDLAWSAKLSACWQLAVCNC